MILVVALIPVFSIILVFIIILQWSAYLLIQRRRHWNKLIYIYRFLLTRSPPFITNVYNIPQLTRGVIVFIRRGVNGKECIYINIFKYRLLY